MATDNFATLQRHHAKPGSLERNATSRDHQFGSPLGQKTGERCSSQATRPPVIPPPLVPVAHLDPRMPLISETSEGSTAASGKSDDVTTTSGSYVIDANDLCQEIDELFFREVQVCS